MRVSGCVRAGLSAVLPVLALSAVVLTATARPTLAQVTTRTIETEAERQRLEIERQATPPRQRGPGLVGPERPPPLTFPGGGATIRLEQVDFGESALLSGAELETVRARYIGRTVDLAAIGELVQAVNDLYAGKGHVTASAILPPQELNDGRLRVQLVEGRVGAIKVTGAVQTAPAYVESQILATKGAVVDAPALNRTVSLFNRLNEAQLRAQLGAGQDFGLTDLDLVLTEPPRNLAQISYDNQGVISTGRYQGALFLKHHGLLGIDDRLIFYGTRSRGSILGSGSYSLPISPFGTRLSLNYTRNAFRIVTGPALELRPEGLSESAALTLSQPVFATDAVLVQATAGLGRGLGGSKLIDIETVRTRYDKVSAGLSLGLNLPTFVHQSTPTFSRIVFEDRLAQAKRDFWLFTGSTSNILRLGEDVYASLVGSLQYSRLSQLPGDQVFQIGGPTTIRGYPIGAAFGDSGYYGQAELHYLLPEPLRSLDAFVFLDHGATIATFPAITRATSIGAGLAWRPVDWATIEGGVGRPLQRASLAQRDHELYFRLTLRKTL